MIRSIRRNIARNRMKDMGFDRVNRRMGIRNGIKGNRLLRRQVRNGMKTPAARDRLAGYLKAHPPVWKRVLEGDLRERAVAAEKAESRKRKMAVLYRA